MTKTHVTAGRYYGKVTENGPLLPAPAGTPDAVICRRVADFPGGRARPDAGLGACVECGAVIAFNPHGPHQDRPKICMQCAHIQPLPIDA